MKPGLLESFLEGFIAGYLNSSTIIFGADLSAIGLSKLNKTWLGADTFLGLYARYLSGLYGFDISSKIIYFFLLPEFPLYDLLPAFLSNLLKLGFYHS